MRNRVSVRGPTPAVTCCSNTVTSCPAPNMHVPSFTLPANDMTLEAFELLFRVVTSCSLVRNNERFVRSCYCRLQDGSASTLIKQVDYTVSKPRRQQCTVHPRRTDTSTRTKITTVMEKRRFGT